MANAAVTITANLNAGGFGEINSLSNGWDSLGRQINLALRLIF